MHTPTLLHPAVSGNARVEVHDDNSDESNNATGIYEGSLVLWIKRDSRLKRLSPRLLHREHQLFILIYEYKQCWRVPTLGW